MSSLLPLYQQIRRVRACKIKGVEQIDGAWLIHPAEGFIDPFQVGMGFINHQRPMAGGYLTIDDKGQMRYLNAAEFESNHIQVDALQDRREQLERELSKVNAAIAAHTTRKN